MKDLSQTEILESNKIVEEDVISQLYTKVYLDTITLDEINNSNIDEFKKMVLKILYCEKRKLPYNLKEIKQAKQKYSYDKDIVMALDELYNKFQTKKFLYINYSIYSYLLQTNLDNEMIEKHNSEKTFEFKQPKKVVIEKIKKPIHKEIQYIIPKKIVTGQLKETRTYPVTTKKKNNTNKQKNIVKSVVKKENKVSNLEEIKIKDIFKPEIIEVQKYLYVQMNLDKTKKTIDNWDKFCILIEKSISDYKALNKFIQIVNIINNNCSYVNVDTKSLNNKMIRYSK